MTLKGDPSEFQLNLLNLRNSEDGRLFPLDPLDVKKIKGTTMMTSSTTGSEPDACGWFFGGCGGMCLQPEAPSVDEGLFLAAL